MISPGTGVYVITGTDYHGKRFHAITTRTPRHYNIYNGAIWEKLSNGKRKKVKTISN